MISPKLVTFCIDERKLSTNFLDSNSNSIRSHLFNLLIIQTFACIQKYLSLNARKSQESFIQISLFSWQYLTQIV